MGFFIPKKPFSKNGGLNDRQQVFLSAHLENMVRGCFSSLAPLIDDLKGTLEGYRENNLQNGEEKR